MAALGGGRAGARGTGACGVEEMSRRAAEAAQARPSRALFALRGARLFRGVAAADRPPRDRAVRDGVRLFGDGARLCAGEQLRRAGGAVARRLSRREGVLLRLVGAALARAGAEALRHRALAGCRAHPRERDHHVHVEGRVRAAVRSGRAGDHGRGEGEPALSAAARVPCLSGENPRYLGRIGRHGLSSGGADGRAQRHQRDGQPNRLRGRAEPPVRRLGAALRVSREPAGDADSGAPAADGRGDDDPCAAVLHADGRHDTVRRPRVHHADFPAARTAFPPRRRQSDVAERSAAGDSAVQSHGRAEHQPAAELCRDARDSAPLGADVPAGGGRDSPEI